MIEKYVIDKSYTVKKAIEKMEEELIKAVVVLDEDSKISGLFSNGDMRAFFLKGGSLSANITEAMNPNPKLYNSLDEVKEERELFNRVIYPIVDDKGFLISVVDYDNDNVGEIICDSLKDIPLVIMAGGKGTRLYPYTKILPKALVPVGDLTITERIIESFERYGCNNYIMILNHKAGMIKAYMNDLNKNYNIEYEVEDKFLGTAGGLRLIKDKINSTFFMTNCDILIDADLDCIYKTHKKNNNLITFVCSMKDIVIPYGVVETDETGSIKKLQEKPDFSFLVNTGLYMIEPEVIDFIKEDEFIHLPELAKRCIDNGKKVGVFPISERSWMDMGQLSEFEEMRKRLGV